MKRKNIFVLFVAMLLLTACGNSEDDGKINMPFGANDYKDICYDEAVSQLEQAGFTNIEVIALDDLVTGWLTEDGEIEEIEVDGRTTFSEDTRLEPDAKIVIMYHTFPEDSQSEDVKEETTDNEGDNAGAEINSIITIDNSEEFAELLSSNENHQLFETFANDHKGEIIAFDGYIDDIQNHGDYDTRYDILLSTGDSGPIFKFEDENTTSMGIKELYLPNFISPGQTVHIVAKVKEYNKEQGVFYLEPVSLEER